MLHVSYGLWRYLKFEWLLPRSCSSSHLQILKFRRREAWASGACTDTNSIFGREFNTFPFHIEFDRRNSCLQSYIQKNCLRGFKKYRASFMSHTGCNAINNLGDLFSFTNSGIGEGGLGPRSLLKTQIPGLRKGSVKTRNMSETTFLKVVIRIKLSELVEPLLVINKGFWRFTGWDFLVNGRFDSVGKPLSQ